MRHSLSKLTIVALLLFSLAAAGAQPALALPLLGLKIALDPGHGGADPGANRAGLTEKEIVLDLGLQLEKILGCSGAVTRLTRRTDADLVEETPPSGTLNGTRKRRDLEKRVELTNEWQPTALVSLHVNAIQSERWRGAQVFYQADNPNSKELAEAIQTSLSAVLQNTDRKPKPGDYRVLNSTEPTAVLVEIGFISNPDEAKLLGDPAYRSQVAWAIYLGICNWLGK